MTASALQEVGIKSFERFLSHLGMIRDPRRAEGVVVPTLGICTVPSYPIKIGRWFNFAERCQGNRLRVFVPFR